MSDFNVREEVTDKFSLRGRVFNKIRDDILNGSYKKDEAINESSVSKQLGVSRTPVREALRQLELEGLVNIIPNRGAVVQGINANDIKDIYQIRSRVEGLAARLCAESLSESILDEFEEIIMLSEFHLSKNHMDQVYHLDNRFHELLYESSNSRILKHLLTDFHHYSQRVRKMSLHDATRAEASIAEHKIIVEAIRSKDGDLAEKLTNEHVMFTYKNLEQKRIAEQIETLDQ